MERRKRICWVVGIALLLVFMLASCTLGSGNNPSGGDPNGPGGGNVEEPWMDNTPIGPDKLVTYASSDLNAGYITGDTTQTPNSLGNYSEVTAVAKIGYKFVKWSDGRTTPSRCDTKSLKLAKITAVFEHEILDMPIIKIDTSTGTDVTTRSEYIYADMEVVETDGTVTYETDRLQIRGRGNSTWSLPKKSYRMKLPSKQNLLDVGKGKEKDWILLACHCDHTLQRVGLAFQLANMLTGIDHVPGSRPVEVYLNGEYRGVYLLTEQTEVAESRVNIDDSDPDNNPSLDFLFEMTAWEFDYGFTVRGRKIGIKSDLPTSEEKRNAEIERADAALTAAYDALYEGNKEKIEALVDLNSLIDTYLLHEITKNFDTGFDSFYMYYITGDKLYFGSPWDYDLALGNANLGSEFYYGLQAAITPIFFDPNLAWVDTSNPWFYNVMEHEWFREMVVARWDEMKETIETLPSYVTANTEQYINSYNRNFEKWPIFGQAFVRTTGIILKFDSYEQHTFYLSYWTAARIAWLDECFHSEDFASGKIVGRLEEK